MNADFREFAKIVLGTIAIAIIYGIAHDLVTAHVDVRYFTEFHPHIIDSQSPIAMALLWGVIATWWMGAFVGCVVALSARAGNLPRLKAKFVLWRLVVGSVFVYVAAMGVLALGLTFIQRPIEIPGKTLDPTLGAILITHNVSYFLSAVVAGGIAISNFLIRTKADPSSDNFVPDERFFKG